MKTILYFILMFLLVACTKSTGIIHDGRGAYRVMLSGDTGFANSGTLQKNAYREAAAFCSKENKIVETIELKSKQARPLGGWPEATLWFRCVNRELKENCTRL